MANLHILLAEGDNGFRASAQRTLTRQGYFVIPVSTAEEALKALQNEPVDVVVADVALMSPDDLELVRAAQARSPAPPVLLTANPDRIATAANGVRQGAADYVLKPIDDFTRLVGLIERVAGSSVPAIAPAVAAASAPESGVAEAASTRFLTATTLGQDLYQLLSLYVAELAQLARAPRVLTALYQENGQLQVGAAFGYVDRAEATRALGLAVMEEFAWRVIEGREALWQSANLGHNDQPSSAQEMLGFPLLYGGHVLGVTLIPATLPRSQMPAAVLDGIKHLTQQASLVVELAHVRELAERRNPSDRVTGLLARTHFFELTDREFRRSWRFGEPIGALEVDVDDFSKIQLLLGPHSGDDVMQQIARSVRPRLRSIDLVGRLDVDKLGILVLMASRETVMSVAERLRRAIAEIELPTPEETWQVTASIGVATYPREQCASVHDLFALAAQATRAAKRAGRNRVVGV
ncbi:MAG: diguanylate cyclase [Anaerolineae bacterium]